MLESIRKNKMSIVVAVLFGAVGALSVPVILGIEKFSRKYPKACKFIGVVIYSIIMAICAYITIIRKEWGFLPVIICMLLAFCDNKKKEDR